VIDTIQWEGFREGVDDVRYLTTLINLLKDHPNQAIRDWVATLKQAKLESMDLDQVRRDIVSRIL
jgi:hypothetical protein